MERSGEGFNCISNYEEIKSSIAKWLLSYISPWFDCMKKVLVKISTNPFKTVIGNIIYEN